MAAGSISHLWQSTQDLARIEFIHYAYAHLYYTPGTSHFELQANQNSHSCLKLDQIFLQSLCPSKFLEICIAPHQEKEVSQYKKINVRSSLIPLQ
jgi:hypothetical protein